MSSEDKILLKNKTLSCKVFFLQQTQAPVQQSGVVNAGKSSLAEEVEKKIPRRAEREKTLGMTLTSVTSDDVSKTRDQINSGMCFDRTVRSTVLTHHLKQITNVSAFKCFVDVPCDYPAMCFCAGMSPVCGGQRWTWVRLFGSYLS